MFLIHLHVDILLLPSLLLRTNLSCFVAIDLRRINGFESQVVSNPDSMHVSGSTHMVGLRAIALMSPIGGEGEVVSHGYFLLI